MTYIVERIEEGFALLQDEEEQTHILPLADLPFPIRQGDVLLLKDGAYTVDEEETHARKSRILRLQNRLRKK